MSDCDCDKVEKVIDLKLDVINARLDAKDVALGIATKDAELQYARLNNLRQTMVTKDLWDIKTQHYDRFERTTITRLTSLETNIVIAGCAIIIGLAIAEVLIHFLRG